MTYPLEGNPLALYTLTAFVSRLIHDNIVLEIEAKDFKQAYNKAYLTLESFPEQGKKLQGIKRCLVVDRKYHEPNILGIEEEKEPA